MIRGVPSFESELESAIAAAQRDLFIEQIRKHPELTLRELLALAKGKYADLLDDVTVGQLLGNPKGRPAKRASRGAKAKRANGASGRPKAVNTRTQAGRRVYDASILSALEASGPGTRAVDLRKACGGSALQVRTALARLIEAGKVTWEGQARGTKYSLSS